MKKFFKVFTLSLIACAVTYLLIPQTSTQDREISSTALLSDDPLYATKISPKMTWEHLQKSPYDSEKLPFQNVKVGDFFSAGENLLLKDSKRTIKSGSHFIPYQRKLLFPMGICLKGTWSIDRHAYSYTGYFKPGSKGAVIARASTSLYRIYYNEYRTLALSGKIFPTTNALDSNPLNVANFLLMNDNGGVKNEYFTEAPLTNAAPTTKGVSGLPLIRIALAVSKAFDLADERRDIRQLYQIAELGEEAPYSSPKWMVIRGKKSYRELSKELAVPDYRKEIMNVIDSAEKFEMEIFTATQLKKDQPVYERIGSLVFDDYIASRECDQSLHFQHPPYLKKYTAKSIDQDPYENETLDW